MVIRVGPKSNTKRKTQQARKRVLTRNQSCWHLDLGLLVSRAVRNKLLLFKPPRLWYSVTAALADVHSAMPGR